MLQVLGFWLFLHNLNVNLLCSTNLPKSSAITELREFSKAPFGRTLCVCITATTDPSELVDVAESVSWEKRLHFCCASQMAMNLGFCKTKSVAYMKYSF